jgi:crotonobetainyl-CoA:carnitine CoA-transferase CaiB-like acyl-CoA transferase
VLVSGAEARRWGNAHPNLVPYELFDAADRPLVIAVGSDAQWRACAAALGLDALARDDRLATNAGRVAERARVVDAIAERVRRAPAATWIAALERAGVPCGVVRSVREALADVDASPLSGVAPSVPGRVRFPPPRLDEHGSEIRRLGWGAFAGGG